MSGLARFFRKPETVAGGLILAVLGTIALAAPVLFPGAPQAIAGPPLPRIPGWSTSAPTR